jgi:hypothetical protein
MHHCRPGVAIPDDSLAILIAYRQNVILDEPKRRDRLTKITSATRLANDTPKRLYRAWRCGFAGAAIGSGSTPNARSNQSMVKPRLTH